MDKRDKFNKNQKPQKQSPAQNPGQNPASKETQGQQYPHQQQGGQKQFQRDGKNDKR